jgi:hypothetical protein
MFSRGTEVVTGRSRMNGWQEFFQPVLPKLFDAVNPILGAIVQNQLMKNATTAPQPNGTATIQQQPAALPTSQPQNNTASLIAFLNAINPALQNHFKQWLEDGAEEWSGAGFAAWLDDGYGQQWNGIDWHAEAKKLGPLFLVGMYKQSPYWPQIGPQNEQKFIEFIASFCDYDTNAEAEPAMPEAPANVEVM